MLAVLRMGQVSRCRHGQAIVVGIAKPASMAFLVVALYRLTAVASLALVQSRRSIFLERFVDDI